MVTQSLLSQYRREVESASNDARNYLTAMCEAYIEVNPNASVADMRKFAIETLQDGLNMYGDEAKVIANDFFDRLAQDANSKATSEMFDSTDADIVEQKVRYYAKSLAEGDTSKFIKNVSDLTGFYVKREAFCNMAKNCNKAGIRYARVPSGRETCAFCFMLASRGFVYWGEKEAGADGHEYHPHCDCIIVPGFHADSGIDEDAQIEGYKPSEMRERYKKCYDAINPNGTWDEVYEQWKNSDTEDTWQKFKTKALLKEIGTRDWGWVWNGKICKLKEDPEWNNNEKKAASLLRDQGFNVEYNKRSLRSHDRRADFNLNGVAWEMKNPTGNGYLTVHNQFKKAVMGSSNIANPQSERIVISNVGNEMSFETLIGKIKTVFENGEFTEISEVIALDRTGKMCRLKR
jgi:hypothetical protein